MSDLTVHLEAIESLIHFPQRRAEAETQIRALLLTAGKEELRVYEPDLRRVIGGFMPKRRKVLDAELTNLLAEPPPPPVAQASEDPKAELLRLRTRMRQSLAELSQRRIYQWSTAYRDYLFEEFETMTALARDWYDAETVAGTVREELATHATEIFAKGFDYGTQTLHLPTVPVIARQFTGLQRFLELPVEIY